MGCESPVGAFVGAFIGAVLETMQRNFVNCTETTTYRIFSPAYLENASYDMDEIN